MHALANSASKNTAVTVNGAADDDDAVGDVKVSGFFNPAVTAQMNKFVYGLTRPKNYCGIAAFASSHSSIDFE